MPKIKYDNDIQFNAYHLVKGGFSNLSPHNQTLVPVALGWCGLRGFVIFFKGELLNQCQALYLLISRVVSQLHLGLTTQVALHAALLLVLHNERHSVLHNGEHWQGDVRMRNVATKSTSQVPSVVLVEQNTCHCRFVSQCCKWQLLHSEMTT